MIEKCLVVSIAQRYNRKFDILTATLRKENSHACTATAGLSWDKNSQERNHFWSSYRKQNPVAGVFQKLTHFGVGENVKIFSFLRELYVSE